MDWFLVANLKKVQVQERLSDSDCMPFSTSWNSKGVAAYLKASVIVTSLANFWDVINTLFITDMSIVTSLANSLKFWLTKMCVPNVFARPTGSLLGSLMKKILFRFLQQIYTTAIINVLLMTFVLSNSLHITHRVTNQKAIYKKVLNLQHSYILFH